jgi:hypothetical protein
VGVEALLVLLLLSPHPNAARTINELARLVFRQVQGNLWWRTPPRFPFVGCRDSLRFMIELLESRIAPAAINGNTLTYTDTDGDAVTVVFSKGTISDSNFVFDTDGPQQQLQVIDLKHSQTFSGGDITMSIAQVGDGKADIGFLDATGIDLNNVSIAGDLSRIAAGDRNVQTPALQALGVDSFGMKGFLTQTPDADFKSDIIGSLTVLQITQNFENMWLKVHGSIGTLEILGSVIGGDADENGYILATGSIADLTVGGKIAGGTAIDCGKIRTNGNLGRADIGSILGGTNHECGKIRVYGKTGSVLVHGNIEGGTGSEETGVFEGSKAITSITVMGSIIGRAAVNTGIIGHSSIGVVEIDHDLQGGSGSFAGSILAEKSINEVKILGSVLGGSGEDSGEIIADQKLGKVTIGANLMGGLGENSGSVEGFTIASIQVSGNVQGGGGHFSASIDATHGNLGSVVVGGNVTGGDIEANSAAILSAKKILSVDITGNLQGGAAEDSGEIFSKKGIGTVAIHGSILGGSGTRAADITTRGGIDSVTVDHDMVGSASDPLFVTAIKGSPDQSTIKAITVSGDMTNVNVLAGFDDDTPKNADATIDTVSIGGDFTGSNIIAGVKDVNSDGFGNPDDKAINQRTPALSSIGTISIFRAVESTPTPGDRFGIEAEFIHSVTIGVVNVVLSPRPHNDFELFGPDLDVAVQEV